MADYYHRHHRVVRSVDLHVKAFQEPGRSDDRRRGRGLRVVLRPSGHRSDLFRSLRYRDDGTAGLFGESLGFPGRILEEGIHLRAHARGIMRVAEPADQGFGTKLDTRFLEYCRRNEVAHAFRGLA